MSKSRSVTPASVCSFYSSVLRQTGQAVIMNVNFVKGLAQMEWWATFSKPGVGVWRRVEAHTC